MMKMDFRSSFTRFTLCSAVFHSSLSWRWFGGVVWALLFSTFLLVPGSKCSCSALRERCPAADSCPCDSSNTTGAPAERCEVTVPDRSAHRRTDHHLWILSVFRCNSEPLLTRTSIIWCYRFQSTSGGAMCRCSHWSSLRARPQQTNLHLSDLCRPQTPVASAHGAVNQRGQESSLLCLLHRCLSAASLTRPVSCL